MYGYCDIRGPVADHERGAVAAAIEHHHQRQPGTSHIAMPAIKRGLAESLGQLFTKYTTHQ